MTQDDPARALHSPFTLPDDWDPIPGTCSRCHGAALLAAGRWWHDGPACSADRPAVTAEFRPLTRISIDPNVRVRGNLTYSTLDNADGPLAVGMDVEVCEPESGLTGPGRVQAIEGEFVYLDVPWSQLREVD